LEEKDIAKRVHGYSRMQIMTLKITIRGMF